MPEIMTPQGPRRLLPLDRRSPFDPRDFRYSPTAPQVDPTYSADNEATMPPIRDQGQEGSCAGHASSEYLGHLYRRAGSKAGALQQAIFSPAFAYYEARALEGTTNEDAGAYLRDEFKALNKTGCCLESFMPYVPGQYAQPPSPQALADAAQHRIDAYAAVQSPADLDAALAEGRAVAVASYWYDAWGDGGAGHGAVLPDPTQPPAGGHAYLICASKIATNPYTGQTERLDRIHNSWGTDWGDGTGHAWIPRRVLLQQAFELWVAEKSFPQPAPPQPGDVEASASVAIVAAGDAQVIRAQPDPQPNPQPNPQPTPQPDDLFGDVLALFQQLAQLLQQAGVDIKKILNL